MDTEKPDLQAVVERLEKVERQNHRLRLAGAVALLLIGAVVLVGATTPKNTDHSTSDFKFKSVEVEKLVVRDKQGETRALLVVDKDGPGLMLYDSQGETRTSLTVDEAGPKLRLLDAKGRTRFGVGVLKDESIGALIDAKDETGDTLGIAENGPRLILCNENEKIIWQAPSPVRRHNR